MQGLQRPAKDWRDRTECRRCAGCGQRRVDTGELAIVGLNTLRIPEADGTLLKEASTGKIEPFRGQSEKIARLRRERDIARAPAVSPDGLGQDVWRASAMRHKQSLE